MNETYYAVDQVADSVRQVLVGPRDQLVDGEIRIADARHIAHEPPAQRVCAVTADERDRIVRARIVRARLAARAVRAGSRLADLAPSHRKVVVHEDLGRQRLA